MANMEINYASLGERIRRLRHSMNITQDSLAARLNISPSFLGHLERGSRRASLETLVALCNHLRVSPEYLLADSLDSDSFPSARKLTPRQQTALNEIFHVIEATIVDWNTQEPLSGLPQDDLPQELLQEAAPEEEAPEEAALEEEIPEEEAPEDDPDAPEVI